jgi:hypothetical protein
LFGCCNMFAFFVFMTYDFFGNIVVNYDVIAKRHVILEYFM